MGCCLLLSAWARSVSAAFALEPSADSDGDGVPDTDPAYAPYSHGRPTVHNMGANVGLLDGHVERVPFKRLWQVSRVGQVVHSYWYLED